MRRALWNRKFIILNILKLVFTKGATQFWYFGSIFFHHEFDILFLVNITVRAAVLDLKISIPIPYWCNRKRSFLIPFTRVRKSVAQIH